MGDGTHISAFFTTSAVFVSYMPGIAVTRRSSLRPWTDMATREQNIRQKTRIRPEL